MVNDPFLGMLGLARRAGKLAFGDELVRESCTDKKARCVFVAADAGMSTAKKAAFYAESANVPLVTLPHGKDVLGAAIGKNGCAVCAVTDIGLAAAALQKLAAFEKKHANTEFLHPGLRRALAFLYNNSSRNISVEQIAEESGISVSLLRKLFVDYCGVSPVHFLQNLRISRAEEMLKNSNLSISEIALTCGFENSGYFIRFYRRRYGTPPGRRRNSGKN